MSIPREIQTLLDTSTLASLGPECRADALSLSECQAALNALDLHPRQQPLIHSALLLWHDHLDASHDLSQNISSSDGSFLHGIMHRREPDYSNAKYWFTRTGQHAAFHTINTRATEALKDTPLAHLAQSTMSEWDPFEFVDIVSQTSSGIPEYEALQAVQKIEFEVLIERFCL